MVEELEKNDRKLIIALIASSCIIAGFFTFIYIDINRKLELLSGTSGIYASPAISPGEIYDKTIESVVLIEIKRNSSRSVNTQFNCSGFIYNKNGYIITVNSSIANAEEVRVKFTNGTEVKAKVVGFDEYSNLAVLKISGNSSITQQLLKLGDSSNLRLTERIYIVGKLFGDGHSMISGELSRLGCALWFREEFPLIDVIEFSATVCTGTLGAPLLNSKGDVVGIVIKLAEEGGVSNVGYALSSEILEKIVSSIIKRGNYTHPWLKGVKGIDLTQQIAKEMNISFTHGFLVTHVDVNVTDGNLHGGNQTVIIEGKNITIGGDVIIKVDEREVRGLYNIIDYLEKYEYKNIGGSIALTIFRGGEIMNVSWEIGKVKEKILD